MSLPLRPLGQTGLAVTTLGFGGAPLGNLFSPVSDAEAQAVVVAALAEVEMSAMYVPSILRRRASA